MIKPDLVYLESISGGDKDFITSMLNLFIVNTYPELDLLKQSAENQRWQEMGSIAHKMKAPIQMLGVPPISDLVLEIEMMGKRGVDTVSAVPKIQELENQLQELRKGVEWYLTQ